jgi:hypothetical protein
LNQPSKDFSITISESFGDLAEPPERIEANFTPLKSLQTAIEEMDNQIYLNKNIKTLQRLEAILREHKLSMSDLIRIKQDEITSRRQNEDPDFLPRFAHRISKKPGLSINI